MEKETIRLICKSIIEERTGVIWRKFYINKVEEKRGYSSKRLYYNCYVSWDNCDKIYSDIITLSPSQIRNKTLELILS